MNLINEIKTKVAGAITFPVEEGNLTLSEKIAIKNIIEVAKERLWLHDSFSAIDYDYSNFDTDLDDSTISSIKNSIKLMEAYLSRNSTKE
tara:strand:- start:171 stop:440 length:270 start_codon:yes stop_codon:yes gene_type:complete